MGKNYVYQFSDTGYRVLTNPENLEAFAKRSDCVVNPDLTAVLHLAPHLCILKDGKVAPAKEKDWPSLEARALSKVYASSPSPKSALSYLPWALGALLALIALWRVYAHH